MRTRDEDLLRELAPRVLAAVARRIGDFADAEDAVQEALIAATAQWPSEGVPGNPRGWLVAVAMRRAADRARSDGARRERERAFAAEPPAPPASDRDDALALLVMCCHPALTPASAIPLTLRAAGGLTTAEIARALLVPERTMAQRLSRAKQRIRASGVPFGAGGTERLPSVLHVLYLIFTEGHAATSGAEVARAELSREAIRLARMIHAARPDHAEAAGLLALMLLGEARRPARTGPAGELIPLAEQDRALWDRALIAEGTALVEATLPKGAVGEYQLQAAIAALHDEAATAEATDWPQILLLYGLLERMTGNPVVRLNRAVAAAMVDGPAAGLVVLDTVALDGYHRVDAVRAHLLDMAGDREGAAAHYRAAAERTASTAERDYLLARAYCRPP